MNLTVQEYDTASRRKINQQMSLARRHYANGSYKTAASAARKAFLLSQAIRDKETKAYADKMTGVVEDMERINELLKAVKQEVKP